jgi:hypothetical protein
VDAYLAVASKRDQHEDADRPVAEDAVRRILDAGRIAGRAKNRPPCNAQSRARSQLEPLNDVLQERA